MPFTPSHVAAVLPFARTPLPPAALAMGAMAPDLVFFVPVGLSRGFSHSLIGAVTLDPVIAIVGLALWWWLLRPALLDLGPAGLRARMTPEIVRPAAGIAASILLVAAAVLIGIATHLAWDWFTHPDGLASLWRPWRVRVGPLPLTGWLQYGSSLVGAVILIVWARSWWRRTAPIERTRWSPSAWTRVAVAMLAIGAVIGCAAAIVRDIAGGVPGGVSRLAFHAVVAPIAVAGALAILIAVFWTLRVRPERAERLRRSA